MLKRYGFAPILQAECGIDCIAMAKKKLFDFLLLDVSMQGLSGLDTCKILRTFLSTKKSRIVRLHSAHQPQTYRHVPCHGI
jgi:CheY-like chemotaxis protein